MARLIVGYLSNPVGVVKSVETGLHNLVALNKKSGSQYIRLYQCQV